MLLHQEKAHTAYPILGYSPKTPTEASCVRIGAEAYHHSFLLARDWLLPHWRPQTLQELNEADWEPIWAQTPQLIIMGYGDAPTLPDTRWLTLCYQHGLGFEAMNNAAACRTFMALISEGREVMLALLQEG